MQRQRNGSVKALSRSRAYADAWSLCTVFDLLYSWEGAVFFTGPSSPFWVVEGRALAKVSSPPPLRLVLSYPCKGIWTQGRLPP